MDEQMKSRLTSKDVWLRALYIAFFAIAWGLSEVLLVFSVIFQWLTVLVTGSANLPLLRFGQNLSRYHYQIARFVSFNTEERPFPFADWPDDAPGGESWMGSESEVEPSEPSATEDPLEPEPATAAPADEDAEVSESRKDEVPPPA